jgi:hypothetical protein
LPPSRVHYLILAIIFDHANDRRLKDLPCC